MKRALIITAVLAVTLLVVLIGFAAAWHRGFASGRFQAGLEENKIAADCLRAEDLKLSPDFREYLKGRIYYNLASKFPNQRGYLLRSDWDFGAVDVSLLKGRIYAKDPDYECESFDAATSHLTSAEPSSAANGSQPIRPEGE